MTSISTSIETTIQITTTCYRYILSMYLHMVSKSHDIIFMAAIPVEHEIMVPLLLVNKLLALVPFEDGHVA